MNQSNIHVPDILSLQEGTPISGKVLREWIQYQIDNHTSKEILARNMARYFSMDDESYYILIHDHYQSCITWNRYLIKKVRGVAKHEKC